MIGSKKLLTTIRCIHMVSRNYRALQEGNSYRATDLTREQMRYLKRWLAVIDRAYNHLRSRKNKTSARIRKDWLVARVIAMMVYENADKERIRLHLTGPRPLSASYIEKLTEEALFDIIACADEEGLFI